MKPKDDKLYTRIIRICKNVDKTLFTVDKSYDFVAFHCEFYVLKYIAGGKILNKKMSQKFSFLASDRL